MRLNFRHGIVSTQATPFLFYNSNGNIDLLANNKPLTITVAHKHTNYLHSEDNTVVDAWENTFSSTQNYWLYIEFDSKTLERTFGFTEEAPVAQAIAPTNPTLESTWFNTDTNEQFRWIGSAWASVIRIFIARLYNTSFFSVSQDSPAFTGTQIGNTQSILAGRFLFSEYGNPVIRSDKTFFTTEDQFFTNQSQVIGVRLEANVTTAKNESQTLAQYQIVSLDDNGAIQTAQYDDTENRVIAVVTEDLLPGETGNIILQGTVTNPNWDFSSLSAGTRLWVDNGVLVDSDPHVTDTSTYPTAQVPVAKVLSNDTIIFDQGLGGVGPRGPTGSVDNLPAASTTSLGAVALSVPSATANQPIVVGSNDPRLVGAPFTPVGHTHTASEISVTTVGNVSAANVQLAIEELDTEKFNISGGTLTGTLVVDGTTTLNSELTINNGGMTINGNTTFNDLVTLSADPIAPFEAVTKRYVDNLTSGLQWLDPVCLANLIGDNVNDPSGLTPEDGDAYILPSAGVGDWAAFAQNDVVRWDNPNATWISGGQVDVQNFPELRFLIAGTSQTPATGSFVGREREIAVYASAGATPTYDVPVNTNAVYVCNAFSAAAYNQYVYDDSADIWRQTGGSQNGLAADELTITQVGSTISTISHANGGQVDAATYRGLDLDTVYSPLTHNHDTVYSQIGHTHNAVDINITTTPLSPSNAGTPAVVANTQITSTDVRAAFLEILEKKATNQPIYTTLADLPPASASRGMNALVLLDNTIRFAIDNDWVEMAQNDGTVQNHEHRINYDLSFFSSGPVAVDSGRILTRILVPRAVQIPPNSELYARVINPPTNSVSFQIAINGVLTAITITFAPSINGGLFVNGDTGAQNFVLSAGDYIDLISPQDVDTSISDIALVIVGIANTGTP